MWIINQTQTWLTYAFSIVKLNQKRCRGFETSGRTNRSYSNSLMRSTRPKLPVEIIWKEIHSYILIDMRKYTYISISSLFNDWQLVFQQHNNKNVFYFMHEKAFNLTKKTCLLNMWTTITLNYVPLLHICLTSQWRTPLAIKVFVQNNCMLI